MKFGSMDFTFSNVAMNRNSPQSSNCCCVSNANRNWKEPKAKNNKYYDAKWRPMSAGSVANPNYIMLDSGHTEDCPCYKRWMRHKELKTKLVDERSEASPGPIYTPNLKLVKPTPPAFSVGQQIDIKYTTDSPGPALYRVNDMPTRQRSPSWKWGERPKIKVSSTGPAPNEYNVFGLSAYGGTPVRLAPKFLGRPKDRSMTPRSQTPGPNAYNVTTPFTEIVAKWSKVKEKKEQGKRTCVWCSCPFSKMSTEEKTSPKSKSTTADSKTGNSMVHSVNCAKNSFTGGFRWDSDDY